MCWGAREVPNISARATAFVVANPTEPPKQALTVANWSKASSALLSTASPDGGQQGMALKLVRGLSLPRYSSSLSLREGADLENSQFAHVVRDFSEALVMDCPAPSHCTDVLEQCFWRFPDCCKKTNNNHLKTDCQECWMHAHLRRGLIHCVIRSS